MIRIGAEEFETVAALSVFSLAEAVQPMTRLGFLINRIGIADLDEGATFRTSSLLRVCAIETFHTNLCDGIQCFAPPWVVRVGS